MKPIYIDLHIHTSNNADKLNSNYDVELLLKNIKKYSNTSRVLISLTDHNTINTSVYRKLLNLDSIFILLGVELHIRNYPEMEPYHCHIYFDLDKKEILSEVDNINAILDKLYPIKMVNGNDNIPKLEDIVKSFDKYSFSLLPHGGQSHRTFDESIPANVIFDTELERSIYYNQFDGFTSRTNLGIEKTKKYFKKMGISSFINLITCSDNYEAGKYPNSKNEDEAFIPTWMLSEPTYSGLRLALSEETRLIYQRDEPVLNDNFIKKVEMKSDLVEIDVNLTQGLNVIIGGSSSGKTLFIDSIYRKLLKKEESTNYSKFRMNENLKIDNPSGFSPYYINQNFIIEAINNNSDIGIQDIALVKNVFGKSNDLDEKISTALGELRLILNNIIDATKNIEDYEQKIKAIPVFHKLILKRIVIKSPYEKFKITSEFNNRIKLSEDKYNSYTNVLKEIALYFSSNPFIDNHESSFKILNSELEKARSKFNLSSSIQSIVTTYAKDYNQRQSDSNKQDIERSENFTNLKNYIENYVKSINKFNKNLLKISEFKIEYETKPIIAQGHTLSIENKFSLNEEIVVNTVNHFLKTNKKITCFKDINYRTFYLDNFVRRNPLIKDYSDLSKKIFDKISDSNRKEYKIITKEGNNFNELSPGWKTGVILDLILGYEDDNAPILIDQPEDNLATNYINKDLVNAIKSCKNKKQIIIVSHNATIPMMADAQNIILCRNENGKIIITSNPMEGKINNKPVLDSIAEITDGGKSSIKKRVKKYNLKKFREDE